MVELDQFKYTLGTYKQPLEEIKDSLDLVNKEQGGDAHGLIP